MEKGECILYPCYFNAAYTRAHWARREGRVVAEWHESKSALMKKVAQKLEVRK